MFADASKLEEVVIYWREEPVFGGDIDRPEKWSGWNFMKFNKSKWKLVHLGRKEWSHATGQARGWLGRKQLCRKSNLWGLGGQEVKCVPALCPCCKEALTARNASWAALARAQASGGVEWSFPSLWHFWDHIWKNVSNVGLPSTGKTLPSGASPVEGHRDTRVISGLTHLKDKEGLGDWISSSLSCPRGRRSYCSLQLLSVGVDSLRENGGKYFSEKHSDKMRGDGCKSEHGKFGLDTREYFFNFRVLRLGTGCPESLPKYPWSCWKLYWTGSYPVGLLWVGEGLETAEVSSNLHYFVCLQNCWTYWVFKPTIRLELSCQEFYRGNVKATCLERGVCVIQNFLWDLHTNIWTTWTRIKHVTSVNGCGNFSTGLKMKLKMQIWDVCDYKEARNSSLSVKCQQK